jgi:ferredoxin
MHKLCFFEQRYGKSLCVGCGRCVEKCPVALDITVLIDEVGAAVLEGGGAAASAAAQAAAATPAAPAADARPGERKGGGDASN